MRPNAGQFHVDWRDEAERTALLQATRTNAGVARLRSLAPCETCPNIIVQVYTDPRSLAVPRFCTACQPTAILENNA